MGFAHDGNNSDATGGSDRFGFEKGGQFEFVVVGEGADDVDQFGCFGDFVFPGYFVDEGVQDYFLSLLVDVDQSGNDLGDVLHVEYVLVDFLCFLFVGFGGRFINFAHQL